MAGGLQSEVAGEEDLLEGRERICPFGKSHSFLALLVGWFGMVRSVLSRWFPLPLLGCQCVGT